MTCRFCSSPRRPHRIPTRPAPETCGSYRCRGQLANVRGGAARIEKLRAAGQRGGRTSHVRKWSALLEVWMSQSPREALRLAYAAGYHAGHQSRPDVRVQAGVKRRQRVAA